MVDFLEVIILNPRSIRPSIAAASIFSGRPALPIFQQPLHATLSQCSANPALSAYIMKPQAEKENNGTKKFNS